MINLIMKSFIIYFFKKLSYFSCIFLKVYYNKIKMLTIIEAAELLNLCPIYQDIQKKILLIFIGINGTNTSNIIKLFKNTIFNDSLDESNILKNDTNTLWSVKVFLNNCKFFETLNFKNLKVLYELRLAYLTSENYDIENYDIDEVQRQICINNLLSAIKQTTNSELYRMYYNLDRYNYKYLATLTAHIITKAIRHSIIYKFEPIASSSLC